MTPRQRCRVLVLAQNNSPGGDDTPQPKKDEGYYDRLLKLEADPVPRDNLTSNLKLGVIFVALLAALVYGFLHSNGLA